MNQSDGGGQISTLSLLLHPNHNLAVDLDILQPDTVIFGDLETNKLHVYDTGGLFLWQRFLFMYGITRSCHHTS